MSLALAVTLVACGDGVGRPLIAADEQPSEGVGGSGGGVATGYCDRVATWPAEWESLENGAWNLVNELRETGVACSGEPVEPPPLLNLVPALRCAARLHSEDMVLRDFFGHVNEDGVNYPERIQRAGYSAVVYGESIARGDQGFGGQVPWSIFQGLADQDCENLVDPRFDSVGIGYYEGVWTLDFAGR